MVAPIAERLADGLAEAAPWTAAAAFIPTVQAWAWVEGQRVLYRAWFDEHGLVTEDGEPRPGLGRSRQPQPSQHRTSPSNPYEPMTQPLRPALR